MTTINEMREGEKLRTGLLVGIQAGAATVGRPKGRNGKNLAPRRAVVTPKEAESLRRQHEVPHGSTTVDMTQQRIKAGGPGSGRHKTSATARSFGYHATANLNIRRHDDGHTLIIDPDGSWMHRPHGNAQGSKQGSNAKELRSYLKSFSR